jgi:hypothetical protein
MTPGAEVRAPLACTTCGRVIEVCSFCERADCPAGSICYRCLRIELKQQPLVQPHGHGG